MEELTLRAETLRSTFAQEAASEFRQTTAQIFDLRERLRPAQDAEQRQRIVAPIGGEIVDMKVTTVGAVMRAQEELDDYTLARRRDYDAAADGELAVPPLWFTFQRVAMELEMSATVAGGQTGDGRLFCRTADPTMVGLYGYGASAGVKVRLLMGPNGLPIIKDGDGGDVDPAPPPAEP